MTQPRWGIVGIGKLGKAIIHQFREEKTTFSFYHPNKQKLEDFHLEFPYTEAITKPELASLSFLLLALPAQQIIPFLNELESESISLNNTLLINLATVMPTAELKSKYPHLQWLGLKFMGHSEDLRLHGNGLFIADKQTADDSEAAKEAIEFFSRIGKVIVDDESTVEKLNTLATYHAIKAAKELEQEIRRSGFPNEYEARALSSIAPEVLRSYVQGTMGHFAKKIADSFDQKEKDEG